ncbi:GRAM domain-containing protein 3-like isoform X1 [Orbicella faveolata]|uniref:GRAM domain-containing protein 3-like isoform X1 n=1 Tax=Orbicella faveolata TaxID=48498 RepID=UPI0009E37D61|nr:GRAM domain-containing protein 3-like isoform X1 [Orbicella faveolata]
MCLPIVNLHLQLFLANHSTFCALCGHFLLTEFILGLNKSSSTREIISTRLVYRLRSIQYVSWIAICCDKIRKGFAARSMNPGKRKLRRRNSVFGRSKDDTFQITNKGRRKGANSQNRWSLLSTRTPYEEFHRLFKNVPMDQFPINDFSCALSREILLQGRIYIAQGWFCFYSNIFGWETQVTIDCTKIQSITREKTAYVVPNAILICTDEEKVSISKCYVTHSVLVKMEVC